jgi:hypothetical protein
VAARGRPHLPGRDAGRVPARSSVDGTRLPEIAVPAEPEDRLAADAAVARPATEGFVAEWRWRHSEKPGPRRGPVAGPGPVWRRTAAGRERACQPVGTHRVGAPVTCDSKPGQGRHPGLPERVHEYGRWKYNRHGAEQAHAGPLVSLRSTSCHAVVSPAKRSARRITAMMPGVAAVARSRGVSRMRVASCGPSVPSLQA